MSTKSHAHPCEGRTKSGEVCGAINTLRTLENGYRCRHHRKNMTLASTHDIEHPMPSVNFETKGDAEKFTQWVLQQGAGKNMDAARMKACLDAVKTWIKLQDRLSEKLSEEFEALVKRAREQYDRLMELADTNVGTDYG